MSSAYIPADTAVAMNDMLDCCVLILAAIDGLQGGRNLVTNRQ